MPKGTVAHHVKVLEDAGLVKVVRTRKVRAMTERYYGRTALLFKIVGDEDSYASALATLLADSADEIAHDAGKGKDPSSLVRAYARVHVDRAREFAHRLEELQQDFDALDEEDERVYGFVAAVYATNMPSLPRRKRRKRG